MKRKKKTKAQLEVELRLLKKQNCINAIVAFLNNVVRWGGVVTIAYFIYLSIDSLAGEKTNADIAVRFFGDIQLSQVFILLFGGGGMCYGFVERKLRKTTIERLQGRLIKFEKKEDQLRSSSGLTLVGSTHPKDMP